MALTTYNSPANGNNLNQPSDSNNFHTPPKILYPWFKRYNRLSNLNVWVLFALTWLPIIAIITMVLISKGANAPSTQPLLLEVITIAGWCLMWYVAINVIMRMLIWVGDGIKKRNNGDDNAAPRIQVGTVQGELEQMP